MYGLTIGIDIFNNNIQKKDVKLYEGEIQFLITLQVIRLVQKVAEVKVALVKGDEPKTMVNRALELIGAEGLVCKDEKVLVKPNCVFPKDPSSGVTTDSNVVEAIIEFLLKRDVRNITIGEGGSRDIERTFTLTGIREVADRHGIRLVNFNTDEGIEIEIPSAKALTKVRISKTVLDSTCIVNVPSLKIHHMAQVTLSMKNLMGVIVGDRAAIMHRRIDDKLVDLASFVKTKLNVIDGIVGSEMDELRGHPVRAGIVIAGTDMVATDSVGSAVMGVDPRSVKHLRLAEKRGLGCANLDSITVLGNPIEEAKKKFRTGFSKERLEFYGFDQDVEEETIRKLFETLRS
jgi:uncharacterized protein (DUF362 family)